MQITYSEMTAKLLSVRCIIFLELFLQILTSEMAQRNMS